MRVVALAAFTVFLAGSAFAQSSNRLVIEVKPRSWLDAGRQVPVGSMQNYVYDTQGPSDAARFGARGSSPSLLPDRFSSGRGIPFESPIFWR
ncbi:hypothetical protein [Rhabdaerophilum sp. SD176]|uniref:hypothetical protein n=1 Tax=Rhabdaerophilum sp. SD176 TaxID=2983548 RepID=UPI0024DF3D75|nr:hypothetical protein [Rhabdaerophilum sp. SD176]